MLICSSRSLHSAELNGYRGKVAGLNAPQTQRHILCALQVNTMARLDKASPP